MMSACHARRVARAICIPLRSAKGHPHESGEVVPQDAAFIVRSVAIV